MKRSGKNLPEKTDEDGENLPEKMDEDRGNLPEKLGGDGENPIAAKDNAKEVN